MRIFAFQTVHCLQPADCEIFCRARYLLYGSPILEKKRRNFNQVQRSILSTEILGSLEYFHVLTQRFFIWFYKQNHTLQ